MSKVEELEEQIRQMSADELAAFRRWFAEFDAEVWDRQLERDIQAGKLDAMTEQALRDHDAGRSTRL